MVVRVERVERTERGLVMGRVLVVRALVLVVIGDKVFNGISANTTTIRAEDTRKRRILKVFEVKEELG